MATPSVPSRARERLIALALVGIGGAIGTACRQGLLLALPPVDGFPVAILIENIVGAFLLGMLVEALFRSGPDTGRRLSTRLLLGTGALGGFTTYSALAVDTVLLLGHSPVTGILYGLGTVVVGAVATGLGIVTGATVARRRQSGGEG